jgi:hypothetical protein
MRSTRLTQGIMNMKILPWPIKIYLSHVPLMSECGKQLPNKAIHDGQIANPSVLRTDIAESVKYTYRERTHGFRDNTVC